LLLREQDIICNTSVQTLKDFRASYFRPGNLIFTGAGVDHDELVFGLRAERTVAYR